MEGINGYVGMRVPTQRGILDVSQLVPGDLVYLYKDNRTMNMCNQRTMIPVHGIFKENVHDIWRLEYSDGRFIDVPTTANIYTGTDVNFIIYALKSNNAAFTHTPQAVIDYYPDRVKPKLFPDPYIAGALIMFGDYDDEYINLPLDRDSVDSLFANKYGVEYADKLGNNTVYFRWANGPEEIPITWREFFPNYNFFAKDHNMDDPMIPDDYMYGTIKDRVQFIRGVFDTGYDTKMFPDECAIASPHEFRLKQFQKMLWSVGILSKVTYDPNLRNARGRLFRLDILGELPAPGMFYDIYKIEHQIHNDHQKYYREPFEMKVVRAERIGRGWTYSLMLAEPRVVFLDENLLPRVSM